MSETMAVSDVQSTYEIGHNADDVRVDNDVGDKDNKHSVILLDAHAEIEGTDYVDVSISFTSKGGNEVDDDVKCYDDFKNVNGASCASNSVNENSNLSSKSEDDFSGLIESDSGISINGDLSIKENANIVKSDTKAALCGDHLINEQVVSQLDNGISFNENPAVKEQVILGLEKEISFNEDPSVKEQVKEQEILISDNGTSFTGDPSVKEQEILGSDNGTSFNGDPSVKEHEILGSDNGTSFNGDHSLKEQVFLEFDNGILFNGGFESKEKAITEPGKETSCQGNQSEKDTNFSGKTSSLTEISNRKNGEVTSSNGVCNNGVSCVPATELVVDNTHSLSSAESLPNKSNSGTQVPSNDTVTCDTVCNDNDEERNNADLCISSSQEATRSQEATSSISSRESGNNSSGEVNMNKEISNVDNNVDSSVSIDDYKNDFFCGCSSENAISNTLSPSRESGLSDDERKEISGENKRTNNINDERSNLSPKDNDLSILDGKDIKNNSADVDVREVVDKIDEEKEEHNFESNVSDVVVDGKVSPVCGDDCDYYSFETAKYTRAFDVVKEYLSSSNEDCGRTEKIDDFTLNQAEKGERKKKSREIIVREVNETIMNTLKDAEQNEKTTEENVGEGDGGEGDERGRGGGGGRGDGGEGDERGGGEEEEEEENQKHQQQEQHEKEQHENNALCTLTDAATEDNVHIFTTDFINNFENPGTTNLHTKVHSYDMDSTMSAEAQLVTEISGSKTAVSMSENLEKNVNNGESKVNHDTTLRECDINCAVESTLTLKELDLSSSAEIMMQTDNSGTSFNTINLGKMIDTSISEISVNEDGLGKDQTISGLNNGISVKEDTLGRQEMISAPDNDTSPKEELSVKEETTALLELHNATSVKDNIFDKVAVETAIIGDVSSKLIVDPENVISANQDIQDNGRGIDEVDNGDASKKVGPMYMSEVSANGDSLGTEESSSENDEKKTPNTCCDDMLANEDDGTETLKGDICRNNELLVDIFQTENPPCDGSTEKPHNNDGKTEPPLRNGGSTENPLCENGITRALLDDGDITEKPPSCSNEGKQENIAALSTLDTEILSPLEDNDKAMKPYNAHSLVNPCDETFTSGKSHSSVGCNDTTEMNAEPIEAQLMKDVIAESSDSSISFGEPSPADIVSIDYGRQGNQGREAGISEGSNECLNIDQASGEVDNNEEIHVETNAKRLTETALRVTAEKIPPSDYSESSPDVVDKTDMSQDEVDNTERSQDEVDNTERSTDQVANREMSQDKSNNAERSQGEVDNTERTQDESDHTEMSTDKVDNTERTQNEVDNTERSTVEVDNRELSQDEINNADRSQDELDNTERTQDEVDHTEMSTDEVDYTEISLFEADNTERLPCPANNIKKLPCTADNNERSQGTVEHIQTWQHTSENTEMSQDVSNGTDKLLLHADTVGHPAEGIQHCRDLPGVPGNLGNPPNGEENTKHPTDEETTKHPTNDENTKHPTNDANTKHPTNDENTKHPTDDENTKHPTDDENTKHPTVDENTKYPTDDENTKHPTFDENTKHPTVDENTKHSTDDENTKHPTDDENTKHPTVDENTKHPTDDENTKHPSDYENAKYPTVCENTKHSTDDENTKHPTVDENTKHPTDDENTKHPTVDENTKHPTVDENTKHPTDDENTKHPTDDENTKHPTDDENTKHPSGDENIKHPTDDENTKHAAVDENTKHPNVDENTKHPSDDENIKHPTDDENTKHPTGYQNTKHLPDDKISKRPSDDENTKHPTGDENTKHPTEVHDDTGSEANKESKEYMAREAGSNISDAIIDTVQRDATLTVENKLEAVGEFLTMAHGVDDIHLVSDNVHGNSSIAHGMAGENGDYAKINDAAGKIEDGKRSGMDAACRGTDKICDVGKAASNITDMTIEQLQQQLEEQHSAMARLQTHAHLQQVKANLLTTSLRAKLRRKEQEMRLMKSEHEQQMSAVLSHLLFLEGHIQKEQSQVLDMLHDKDEIIIRQAAEIEDLKAQSNRYIEKLKERQGYPPDNGLVKPVSRLAHPDEPSLGSESENKVLLRGSKSKQGEKITGNGHKVRFSEMKDRLRRHKSSLELYQHEPLETLVESNLKFGSHENLIAAEGADQSKIKSRRDKCQSLIDYPMILRDLGDRLMDDGDGQFDEFHSPIISRHDSTSSLVIFDERTAKPNGTLSTSLTYGFNELSKSRSVPHALPMVSENDSVGDSFKLRSKCPPTADISSKNRLSTATTTTITPATISASSSMINLSPHRSQTTASSPTESNPFKSFKNVFKRKGSKKKKSTPSTSSKDQKEAVKQQFEKYDLK